MSAVEATLETLFQDFGKVVGDESGCVVDVSMYRPANRDRIVVNMTGQLAYPPRAMYRFEIPGMAIKHAADVAAFLRDITDEHFRPFSAKLTRAASAALLGWQREIDL